MRSSPFDSEALAPLAQPASELLLEAGRGARRVLLVGGSPQDASLVARLAEDLTAWQLVRSRGLADALLAMSEAPMDAVLLDVSLPDSDSLEAVRELGARHPEVPIVVLTGNYDEGASLQVERVLRITW
jgi:DNA-binding NarL/FixJ family response regulator